MSWTLRMINEGEKWQKISVVRKYLWPPLIIFLSSSSTYINNAWCPFCCPFPHLTKKNLPRDSTPLYEDHVSIKSDSIKSLFEMHLWLLRQPPPPKELHFRLNLLAFEIIMDLQKSHISFLGLLSKVLPTYGDFNAKGSKKGFFRAGSIKKSIAQKVLLWWFWLRPPSTIYSSRQRNWRIKMVLLSVRKFLPDGDLWFWNIWILSFDKSQQQQRRSTQIDWEEETMAGRGGG